MFEHDVSSFRLMKDIKTGEPVLIIHDNFMGVKKTYTRPWISMLLNDFDYWYKIISKKNKNAADYLGNWYRGYMLAIVNNTKTDFFEEYFDVEINLE